MRTLDQWFDAYRVSHQHPRNIALHVVCVPAIALSVVGLLAALPGPAFVEPWAFMHWGTLGLALVIAYYLRLSVALGLGMALVGGVFLLGVEALQRLPWPVWQTSLAIFIVGWIGQFVGHLIEGRRPSFFEDVQFLLIGPAWLLHFLYRRFGISY